MINRAEINLNTLRVVIACAGVATLLLAVGLFHRFVISPYVRQCDLDQRRSDQLIELGNRADAVRTKHRQLKAELVTLQKSVEDTLQRLPAASEEYQFVAQVEEVAQANRVEITNSMIGNVERGESLSRAYVTFECIGSFASICRFLDGIDHLTRLTEVARLEIEPGENLQRYPFQATFVLYFTGNSHDRTMRGGIL